MTNWEYLEALANNSPDELQAWFDSEHVETPNAISHGDTAALEREIAMLKAELEAAIASKLRIIEERETYRELLGKAIDFAYAITLLVDEGAA